MTGERQEHVIQRRPSHGQIVDLDPGIAQSLHRLDDRAAALAYGQPDHPVLGQRGAVSHRFQRGYGGGHIGPVHERHLQPLAANPVVTGDPKTVIGIVNNGLSGSITVKGTTYNGQMPAWKGNLTSKQIADVITYIRTAWGNSASPVTEAQVAAGGK